MKEACEAFACEPWIGVYVETSNFADVFLTSLNNFDRKIKGRKSQPARNWNMGDKNIEKYKQDSEIKYIRIIFNASNWM